METLDKFIQGAFEYVLCTKVWSSFLITLGVHICGQCTKACLIQLCKLAQLCSDKSVCRRAHMQKVGVLLGQPFSTRDSGYLKKRASMHAAGVKADREKFNVPRGLRVSRRCCHH